MTPRDVIDNCECLENFPFKVGDAIIAALRAHGWVVVPVNASAEEKAHMIGEFHEMLFDDDWMDENGDTCPQEVPVTWTTIKAIKARLLAFYAPAQTGAA